MGPVLLIAFGGVLAGGTWSLHKQGKSKVVIGGVALAALLAIAAGILWQL